jgi:hypothetical protein
MQFEWIQYDKTNTNKQLLNINLHFIAYTAEWVTVYNWSGISDDQTIYFFTENTSKM